jgi:hypothetical protein
MVNELLFEKITNLADSNGIDALGFAMASEFKDYTLRDSRRGDNHWCRYLHRGVNITGLDKSLVWPDQQTLPVGMVSRCG